MTYSLSARRRVQRRRDRRRHYQTRAVLVFRLIPALLYYKEIPLNDSKRQCRMTARPRPGVKCGFLICYDNNLVENVRCTALLGAEVRGSA
jgi:hypothetical protein